MFSTSKSYLFKLLLFPIYLFIGSFFGWAQNANNSGNESPAKKFEPNFQDKYADSEFIYEKVKEIKDPSAWDKFLNAIIEFLARFFTSSSSSTSFSWLTLIFKIVAILVICFVVYLIVKIIIKQDGNFFFGKKNKSLLVSDFNEDNIHAINFSDSITNAKSSKQYRLAIRYYYLWVLKSYTDKKIIEWDIEKTNRDYSNEIASQITKNQFQYLSYLYDYIWYGEFSIDDIEFTKAETHFLKAINE